MPITTIKLVDNANGQTISLEKMRNIILDKANKQTAELLEITSQTGSAQTPAQIAYKKRKEEAIEYIEERLAASMSLNLLNELMTSGYHELDNNEKVYMKDARSAGGFFGMFVEGKLFNLPKNDSPLADIREINTELKAVSGKKLHVGEITALNINASEIEIQENTDIIALYKIASKMENFMLFNIGTVVKPTGIKMGFREVDLYYTLILKKLWMMLKTQIASNKIISVKSDKPWNAKTMSKTYDVKINLSKVKNVYQFAQIYLEKIDFLNKIKIDHGVRRGFWSSIKNLKLSMLGNKSPKFNFDIMP